MSIHVRDFKWEQGKNDLEYIKLLEKAFENQKAITIKAVAKVRELAKENIEIRSKVLAELVREMESRYFHKVGNEFDNAILEMGKIAESLKK